MNTHRPDNLRDRVWQGAPSTADMTALLDRPNDATRAAIYAAARTALPPPPLPARVWRLVWGRESLALATWAASACLVFSLCIWHGRDIGPGGDLNADRAAVRVLADELEHISHSSLVSENNGMDINDIVFVDELQSISQSLITLADDLERGYEL